MGKIPVAFLSNKLSHHFCPLSRHLHVDTLYAPFANNVQVAMRLTALPSALPRAPQPAITVARRVTLAVSAVLLRLRRLAIAAAALDTSLVSAPRTAVPQWEAVVAAARSATSAARSVTLPATAPREAATATVALEEVVVATAAVPVVTVVLARPPAIRAAVSVT